MKKITLLILAFVLCAFANAQSDSGLSNKKASNCKRIASVENNKVLDTDESDYSNGTFIINEDWFGHQNSTVNFITDKGEIIYRVVQKENPGKQLGATAQYGTIYGGKFYIMSKQDKDPGATVQGARLTICDAKTMKIIKQLPVIATNSTGTSNADGRAFLGVDATKAYVGTSNGIYVMDLATNEIKSVINGTTNIASSDYDALYGHQIGCMVRVNERVFAVHQSDGLLVIDANADTIIKKIVPNDGWGIGSVVLSKDGNLWCSVSDISGSGEAASYIYKVNPSTLDTLRYNMPIGIYPPSNSWYAWTPDGFCASTQHNVIYWNGGENSWFSNKCIYKYDIDENKFSKYIDFTSEDWVIYGCSFRIDPVTDDALVGLYKDFSDETYVIRKYGNDGAKKAEYSLIANYWFPSIPVYNDNAGPQINAVSPAIHDGKDTFVISLASIVEDADNMKAAIVKTVKAVSDENVLAANIKDGDLIIKPLKNGTANVNIQVNSNGKLADTDIAVSISGVTGLENNEIATIRSAFVENSCLHINNSNGYQFMVCKISGELVEKFMCNSDNYVRPLSVDAKGIYVIRGVKGNCKVVFKIIM